MEQENITLSERILNKASEFISAVFLPFFIPLAAFIAMFFFTYLRVMPYEYKLIVLGIVFCFTIMMPVITIYLFLKLSGSAHGALRERSKRFMPYLLSIVSFIFCSMMMYRLNIPWYMNGIILSSVLIMIVFMLVNIQWNMSIHAGGMGAIIGGIISFGGLFGYNPVWLLCIFIVLAGLVGSSRMILGRHTLNEVMAGFTVGLICTIAVLHPSSNLFYRLLF